MEHAAFRIDLSTTVFDPSMVQAMPDGPTSDVMHDGKWVRLPCFGVVVVDFDLIMDPRWREDIATTIGLVVPHVSGPVFTCPNTWKLSHLVKAFGLFKSVGDAGRNGWNRDFPIGFQPNVLRVGRVKGVLWTCKPDVASLNMESSWEGISDDV
ncbi:MAG: hypothetical protein WC761_02245 [Candidatus Paceibacterota bacterium]|jgi:hypothetical protein